MTYTQILAPGPPIYDDPVTWTEKSAEHQLKVNKAIAGQLNTPEAREIVQAELQVLPETLQSIEETFISIGTALFAIDERELVKDPRGGLHRFYPIWNGYFTRYRDVLRKSQKSATTVKFHIGTLLQVATKVKDPNVPLKQKQDALVEYRKYLTKFMKSENEVESELRALSKEIIEFKGNLQRRLENARTDTSREVANLEFQIKQLRQRLLEEDSKGTIPRAFDAARFTFTSENLARLNKEAYACAGLSGLMDLFPHLMRIIEDLVHNYCERNSFARQELDCKKRRLEEDLRKARAKLGEISAKVQEVHDMDEKFTDLTQQIAILSRINLMLVMDTTTLELSLKRMGETGGPVLMESFLDVLKLTYKVFDEALTAYILAAPATVKASPAVA